MSSTSRLTPNRTATIVANSRSPVASLSDMARTTAADPENPRRRCLTPARRLLADRLFGLPRGNRPHCESRIHRRDLRVLKRGRVGPFRTKKRLLGPDRLPRDVRKSDRETLARRYVTAKYLYPHGQLFRTILPKQRRPLPPRAQVVFSGRAIPSEHKLNNRSSLRCRANPSLPWPP
jgi:hypothetical protein